MIVLSKRTIEGSLDVARRISSQVTDFMISVAGAAGEEQISSDSCFGVLMAERNEHRSTGRVSELVSSVDTMSS